MSGWIVDTHAILWWLSDDPQLSDGARAVMAPGDSVLLVSAVSLWEIAIKASSGKLEVPENLPEVLVEQGFGTLDLTPDHAWAVRELPTDEHRDPFDRLLVCQAKLERLPLISNDARLDRYGIDRCW